jgi:hypothetical protein
MILLKENSPARLKVVNNMPQITFDIDVHDLAKVITSMKKNDLETLLLLLTDDSEELLKRKHDLESGKVKALSREEVFDV